jgi:hypothetical protein
VRHRPLFVFLSQEGAHFAYKRKLLNYEVVRYTAMPMSEQVKEKSEVNATIPTVVNLTLLARPERQTTPTNSIAGAKLILEYLKVIVWPVFITLILLVYQPPIAPIMKSLAEKLEAASSVKIGSLTLEVQARANDLGVPDLGLKIGQLSVGAIEELLHTPETGWMTLLSLNGGNEFGLPKPPRLNSLIELEKRGLVEPNKGKESISDFVKYVRKVGRFKEGPNDQMEHENFTVDGSDSEAAQRLHDYGYELTPSGHKAVEAITKAVATQLSQKP